MDCSHWESFVRKAELALSTMTGAEEINRMLKRRYAEHRGLFGQ